MYIMRSEVDVSEVDDNESLSHAAKLSNDEEQAEGIWFAYSASLRIFGEIPDLDEITRHLDVVPTEAHRKGDRRGPSSAPYKHDMWMYTAPVKRSEPLHVHIEALWNTFRGRKQYLLQLKHNLTVDVFLGYRSNCDHAGVEVPYHSLEMFIELQVPFGLSVIVT
jgi:hypothetical protein